MLSSEDASFLSLVKSSYPDFSFRPGKKFLFRPKRSIFYQTSLAPGENFRLLLLHELSHALLGHFSYDTALSRLKIERDAWAKTRLLCKEFSVPFDASFAEDNLDTYRNWVHKKTLCPTCQHTCLELDGERLFCPFCEKTFTS